MYRGGCGKRHRARRCDHLSLSRVRVPLLRACRPIRAPWYREAPPGANGDGAGPAAGGGGTAAPSAYIPQQHQQQVQQAAAEEAARPGRGGSEAGKRPAGNGTGVFIPGA